MPRRGMRVQTRLVVAALLLASLTFAGGCSTDASRDGPIVTLGSIDFTAEVVWTLAERAQGLSGRPSLEPGTGMLFVFDSGRASSFWMKGMLFPLDFVWIGADCRIVDITLNAPSPAPATPDSELPSYASVAPATYNFELTAGEVEGRGIKIGDNVRFSRITAQGAEC